MKNYRISSLLGALLILAAAAVLLRGYVTDDTFIHLRYAQNLLEHGEFAFNPGQESYGATSPLWIGGLVVLLKLGLAPLNAAWLLGLLSGVLVLLLVAGLLAALRWPRTWAAVIVILVAADAWFLRWSLSGMETPLATAALLLLLWPLTGTAPQGKLGRRYFAWGIAAGLAGLVRPEFMLLAPVALPWLLIREVRVALVSWRGLARAAVAAAAGWLLTLAPWFVFTAKLFGRLVPETATAKSYGLTFSPAVLSGSVARSLAQLAVTQGLLWLALVVLAGWVLVGHRRPAPGPCADTGQGMDSVAGRTAGWSLTGIAVTWTLVLIGGYAVKQVWVISRYLAPLAPILVLAGAFLARSLLSRLPAERLTIRYASVILVTAVAVNILFNLWFLSARVGPHTRDFSRGLRECYLALGYWLRDNSVSDAVVAALDIGAVGYGSQRQVLDLMGLVSPELLELGRELGFETMVVSGVWLTVATPDYLVDRTEGPPRWSDRQVHGQRFELLRTCQIEGVGLREPQTWTVSLYRLIPAQGTVAE